MGTKNSKLNMSTSRNQDGVPAISVHSVETASVSTRSNRSEAVSENSGTSRNSRAVELDTSSFFSAADISSLVRRLEVSEDSNIKVGNHMAQIPSKLIGKKMAVRIAGNIEEYRKLVNAVDLEYTTVIVGEESGIKMLKHIDDLSWRELHPGVCLARIYDAGGTIQGYLKIEGKTVKPFKSVATWETNYSVVYGKVRVKGTAFGVGKKDGTSIQPFLKSVELFPGCNISIKAGQQYSLENWEKEHVFLIFVMTKVSANSD